MKRYFVALVAALLLLLGLTACGNPNSLLVHNQSGRDITSFEVSYGEYGQYAVEMVTKGSLKHKESMEVALNLEKYSTFDLHIVDSYGTVYDFFNLPAEWAVQKAEVSVHATGRRQLTLQVLLYDTATGRTVSNTVSPSFTR